MSAPQYGRGVHLAALVASFVAAAGACGPPPRSRAAGVVTPVTLHEVPWNPAHVSSGDARAVVEKGDVVALFGAFGVQVLVAAAPVWSDASVTDWKEAALIPAPDGDGEWICGLRSNGRLFRLRGLRSLEDVTARFGLEDAPIVSLAPLGAGTTAFVTGSESAVAVKGKVAHFPNPPDAGLPMAITGTPGLLAEVAENEVRVLDSAKRTVRRFPLPGALHAALGRDGKLYATTSRAVYAEAGDGTLSLLYDATGNTLHGLVASGDNLWFGDGSELGTIVQGHIEETHGLGLPEDARLLPATRGDVWTGSHRGLSRYSRTSSEHEVHDEWATLAPIFARACAGCHLPDGPAGFDLSTLDSWRRERAAIHEQVAAKKSMPPPGHPLSETDRATLTGWLEGAAGAR